MLLKDVGCGRAVCCGPALPCEVRREKSSGWSCCSELSGKAHAVKSFVTSDVIPSEGCEQTACSCSTACDDWSSCSEPSGNTRTVIFDTTDVIQYSPATTVEDFPSSQQANAAAKEWMNSALLGRSIVLLKPCPVPVDARYDWERRLPAWLYLDRNKAALRISCPFFTGQLEINIDMDGMLDVGSAASQRSTCNLIKAHLNESEIDRTVMIKYETFDARGINLLVKYVFFVEDSQENKKGCIRALGDLSEDAKLEVEDVICGR